MSDDVDFYGHRLASVNAKNTVRSSEDIVNNDGVLLLSKGSDFTQARAELIAKHKLIKPLEHSVSIEKSLDGKELFELLMRFSPTVPGLVAALEQKEAHEVLRSSCEYYGKFSLLRQKLTVLSSQLPEVYICSLFSALAGILIAIELGLNEEQHKVIFISGLMHNTGFLHLAPEMTQNESMLEKDESLQCQAHPIIAKHFLDHIDGLSKNIGTTVADHHERTDGTGYPKHKFGMDLTIESQIIACTDIMINAYQRFNKYEAHMQELVLLVLQFNKDLQVDEIYKAAIKLTKLGPVSSKPPEEVPEASAVLKQLKHINESFDATKKLAFVLMSNTRNRLTRSLASMLGRIAKSVVSTGIAQDEYAQWLEDLSLHPNPDDSLELLKSQVMLDEIQTQLERFKSLIWTTIKTIPKEEDNLLQSVIASYNQLERIKQQYS